MVDIFASCMLIAVGLCLALIMFNLYTDMNCLSIQVQLQSQNMSNAKRQRETEKRQKAAILRFQILKYILQAIMVLSILLTII